MDKNIESLLCCPTCASDLERTVKGFLCRRCEREYPEIDGVASFTGSDADYWQAYFTKRLRTAHHPADAVGYALRRNFYIVRHGLKTILGDPRGLRILDIGCGNGAMTGWLAPQNVLAGVDFTGGMLMKARERGVIPIHADGRRLPFKPERFDWVLAVEVIQHIEDGRDFVRYLGRYARKNGHILISGSNAHSILRKLIRMAMRRGGGRRREPLARLWDPVQLADILRRDHYQVDLFYTMFPFMHLIREKPGVFQRRRAGANFFILARRQA